MITPTKSVLASKTIWGALITALPLVLGLFGLKVSDVPAFTEATTAAVDGGTQLVGLALVIWGRLTAAKALVIK